MHRKKKEREKIKERMKEVERERKKERERERTGRKERKQENRGNIFRLDRDIEHLVHSHLQPLWRTPF